MTTIMKKAERTQAYLKAGFLGFQGSGKTYTACQLLIGLVKTLRSLGHEDGNRPVAMLDTETGASWVKPEFDREKIEFLSASTRSFKDLAQEVAKGESHYKFLIIDSITHFWLKFVEDYRAAKKRSLSFQDWDYLKTQWRTGFTDPFLNSKIHICMCGRAGFTYDLFKDENGRNQAEKTGVKMRGESEMGYEPSLVVWMDKEQDLSTKQVFRKAVILKDRRADDQTLDGQVIDNPDFKSFWPHVAMLNLGGEHVGVDTTRNSQDMFEQDKASDPTLLLGDIKSELLLLYPGQSSADKTQKSDLLHKFLGERNWQRIEQMEADRLAEGLEKIRRFRKQNTATTA